MKIQTKYHGEIELQDDSVIHFESGLPGFLEEKRFTILALGEDESFSILQSLETPGLGFVIVNPFLYFKEYDFKLSDSDVKKLKIESTDDVVVYSILTVQDPFEKTTINLQAPIVLNSKRNLGKQIILNDERYQTKQSLFNKQELVEKG